jgi:hypothetical protein
VQYKNLCVAANGATVHEFSSQYHHKSRASNILLRDPTFVWFSSYFESLPQHLTIKFDRVYKVRRVGVYLHGENNQLPKVVEFLVGVTPDALVPVKSVTLEHRAGEHVFDLADPVPGQYLKTQVLENFGGSGVCVSKIVALAAPE